MEYFSKFGRITQIKLPYVSEILWTKIGCRVILLNIVLYIYLKNLNTGFLNGYAVVSFNDPACVGHVLKRSNHRIENEQILVEQYQESELKVSDEQPKSKPS